MKKIYSILCISLFATAMTSCGDKKDEPTPTPTPSEGEVEVTISTTEIQTKAAVTEFGSGASMNIFAKTYGRIDAPNIVDGVKASYDGSKWTMSPSVKINANQKNAFVYAVAPYDAAYTDAANIPVDINKQVDLMYSGEYVPASLTSPTVKLKMKHALSLLTFNIIPVNGNAAQLKSIKLGGEIFHVEGTMDASSGKITAGKTGEVKVDFNKALSAGGWKSGLPGVWAIPFNTKAGTVDVEITIDGKAYNLIMPEVEMKQGYQYIFRLALTSNGLEFDPSKTETISLNVDEDSEQTFNGYGCVKITADGSSVSTPELTGDAVFGTVSTSTANSPYAPGAQLNVQAGDAVVVESWNSTGFVISSMEGIKTIDLTQYE